MTGQPLRIRTSDSVSSRLRRRGVIRKWMNRLYSNRRSELNSVFMSLIVHSILLLIASLIVIQIATEGPAILLIASSVDPNDLNPVMSDPPDVSLDTIAPAPNETVESELPPVLQLEEGNTQLEIPNLTLERDFDRDNEQQDREVPKKADSPSRRRSGDTTQVPSLPVADLGEALHELTKEILALLEERSKIRIVWCFDRSPSMEQSRQAIS
ncbi:MAG: hypothetical protein KDB27_22185, partial [Planctomycetales bacterium]|nr:hypothetical protein [Planctomycetales bacterium]